MATEEVKNGNTFSGIENRIWELEGVRVVFHAPRELIPSANHGKGYNFTKRLGDGKRVDHLVSRIVSVVGRNVEFTIVLGDGRVLRSNLNRADNRSLPWLRSFYTAQ